MVAITLVAILDSYPVAIAIGADSYQIPAIMSYTLAIKDSYQRLSAQSEHAGFCEMLLTSDSNSLYTRKPYTRVDD